VIQKDISIFDKLAFLLKGMLRNFFIGLSYRHVSFVCCNFFLRTPPFCEHSSIIYIKCSLDPSSLALNQCGFSNTEACTDPVQGPTFHGEFS